MSDAITAAVRTATIFAVAYLINWLRRFGIEVDQPALEALFLGVTLGFTNWLLLKLQEKFPWIGIVLSWGRSTATPHYQ